MSEEDNVTVTKEARLIDRALQEFCATFADEYVYERVAPHLSCLEADTLANLLRSNGLAQAALAYQKLHDCPITRKLSEP